MSQIDCNICHDDAIFEGTERIQPAEVTEIISKIDALDIQLNEASKGSTGSLNLSDFSFLTDVADIAANIESCFQNNNESSVSKTKTDIIIVPRTGIEKRYYCAKA